MTSLPQAKPARRVAGIGVLILSLLLPATGLASPDSTTTPDPAAAPSVVEAQAEIDRLVAERERHVAALQTATEDYVEAQYYLEQAQRKQEEISSQLAIARKKLETSKRELQKYAIHKYRTGSGFSVLEPLVTSNGIELISQRHGAQQVLGNKVNRALEAHEVDARYVAILEQSHAELTAQISDQFAQAQAAQDRAQKVDRESTAAIDAALKRRDQLIAEIARQTQREAEEVAREQEAREANAGGQPDAGAPLTSAPTTAPPTTQPPATTTPPVTTPPETQAPPANPDPTTPPTTTPPTTTPPTTAPPSTGDLGKGTAKGTAAQGLAALAWAEQQIGKWYQYGAAGPNTFDCSGLTMRAWQAAGVNIPRSSRLQYQHVKKIERSQMRPGDLLFWANNPKDPSTIRHVAIYVGNNTFVEAPSTGYQLRYSTLTPSRSKDLMQYAGRV